MNKKQDILPKYLYHATSQINLISLLEKKFLAPIGKRINGYDEDTVSMCDILSDYVPFYGDCVIEFKADSLFKRNKIYPYKYDIDESNPEFYDLPFWEAEWRAQKVQFIYFDISRIYFLAPPLLKIVRFLKKNDINYTIIKESDLPSYSEDYLIERYKKRIRYYADG